MLLIKLFIYYFNKGHIICIIINIGIDSLLLLLVFVCKISNVKITLTKAINITNN